MVTTAWFNQSWLVRQAMGLCQVNAIALDHAVPESEGPFTQQWQQVDCFDTCAKTEAQVVHNDIDRTSGIVLIRMGLHL